MPTYNTDWKGANRWLVTSSNGTTTIAGGNLLTFGGTGGGGSTGGNLDRTGGSPATWGSQCLCNSAGTAVVLLYQGGGKYTITRNAGSPPTLTCDKGGPEGPVWTAQDQYPPP
jgi:hypothetical protein